MVYQINEYDHLTRVITCPPMYMEIRNIINETQRKYQKENINTRLAMQQYQNFVQTLKKLEIEVIELTPSPDLNEQVFTRDIGFTIDEHLFTCKMEQPIRKGEVEVLQQTLQQHDIDYQPLTVDTMEGGDIVITDDIVYAGNSNRTTAKAIQHLQQLLPDKQIVPLPMRKDILHLDCCFNLVSEREGLIYDGAFSTDDVRQLHKRFDLIEVSAEEQFYMGTNVLSLGDGVVISLPENKRINQKLEQKGFQVIEVPFSEIIKSGGSFRCCTLPVQRKC
ncbi:dimethylarginine dimethylaminohydrolase family protein [Gracilibacillus timonensis]|uniref:dimethylarginine dimethylaminohydrolase family protein n=1 Tax=Gracilibacillus timonensis TaxID=1816696 RepID=UPI000826EA60|nr:arginine deiminase family protein [Gracilibacillus timonensis]